MTDQSALLYLQDALQATNGASPKAKTQFKLKKKDWSVIII